MPRALLLILAATIMIVASDASHPSEPSELITQAQDELKSGNARRVVELLESALPGATSDTRHAILRVLKTAYPLAIIEVESQGNQELAENLRDHLAILDALIIPEADDGASRSLPSASPGPAPLRSQTVADESHDVPPDPARDQTPVSTAVSAPGPGTLHSVDASAAKDLGPEGPSPSPPGPLTEESRNTVDQQVEPASVRVAAADAAFLAKNYVEANRLYTALAQMKQLPDERRDPWAYCRMVEVVRRINANPKTAQEWDWIRIEIAEIRSLSPQNWYAEYLRNLATELSTTARRGGSRNLVMRGASPDDPAIIDRPALANAHTNPVNPTIVGRPGESVNQWQAWETANFRILHNNKSLAQQVARIAETTKEIQEERWRGSRPATSWEPRCDIYLYPTASSFSQMTGQPAESPGFSTMALNGGQVTVRRVNLRADHDNLLNAIIPHEITHVVLADLFPLTQIPRWADEGMAVLSEPITEQDLRAADLSQPLASSRLFKLSDLMTMDYPEAQYWSLYYAQSVSLTRFLVEIESPARFIEFLQESQRNGIEPELKRFYGIDGFEELSFRWREHAQKQVTRLATANVDQALRQVSDESAVSR